MYRIIYVGATIRQCKKHIIKHQHQFIGRTLGAIKSQDDKTEFLKSIEKNLQTWIKNLKSKYVGIMVSILIYFYR